MYLDVSYLKQKDTYTQGGIVFCVIGHRMRGGGGGGCKQASKQAS